MPKVYFSPNSSFPPFFILIMNMVIVFVDEKSYKNYKKSADVIYFFCSVTYWLHNILHEYWLWNKWTGAWGFLYSQGVFVCFSIFNFSINTKSIFHKQWRKKHDWKLRFSSVCAQLDSWINLYTCKRATCLYYMPNTHWSQRELWDAPHCKTVRFFPWNGISLMWPYRCIYHQQN